MKAILTDSTKCIDCSECVSACKKINGLPRDYPRFWQKNDGLSASNWTSIVHINNVPVRKQCRHCLEPACESVCPVGALHKTESGAVVYDKEKCIGCRYCMMACPYGIPRYDWDKNVPYIKKCIMCHGNIESGKIDQPACTKACPEGATIYGDRDELLKEARRRIKENPGLYEDHIYGEKEVGGTNVIYITSKDAPLDFLKYYKNRAGDRSSNYGMPDINEPIPNTTKAAMQSVPFAFLGMGAIMSGAYWVINRRQKLESENAEDKSIQSNDDMEGKENG